LNHNDLSPATLSRASQRSVIMNPKTGKLECVFSDLEAIYPKGADVRGEEYSFEELRARHRGWFDRDWSQSVMPANKPPSEEIPVDHEMTCRLELPEDQENSQPEPVLKVMPDSHAPQAIPLKGDLASSKRAKKEEKANRTRKIKIMETRTETQTGMQ
jgi:checkpoint serine/threonine-protein kinase